ncbi:MAG TPA: MFS transporter [Caulobacteraceae bacterium]|jgi:MFS family permease|nr:MFS transporter [Caulobacteraceae bacterium]
MPKIEWRPWILVSVFSALLFLITAATYNALGVVLPAMVKEEGWSWTEAGFGFTLLGAATGGSSFLPPMLIRRWGVRTTLLCGTAVMASGFFCLGETHRALVYFVGTTLCGIGYQMMALIPGTYMLAAMFKHRALPFGIYFTSAALGGIAGPFMVFAIMDMTHGQWRDFWMTQAAAAVIVGVICALLVGGTAALEKASRETDQEVAAEAAAEAGQPRHSGVYRTVVDWTTREALRTPQFYILLAAYFGHLLIGVTVASVSVAHLTQRGVTATVAGTMLSIEALMQTAGRTFGGLIGDRIDPRWLLMVALGALVVGSSALSVASSYPMMLLYAVGSGVGFGLTLLTVTVLLLNYYGRKHNLEIFSITCLIGAVSALGPTIGGGLRDLTGSFTTTFQLFAGVIAVILVAVVFMRPPHRAPSIDGTGADQPELPVQFAQDHA